MEVKKHIQYLLDLEKMDRGFMFTRTGPDRITLSYPGYKNANLSEAQDRLLSLGCRYDFTKNAWDVEQFDAISGRTFVYFKEPKS